MQRIGIIINPHAKSIRKSGKDMPAIFRKIGGEYADVRVSSTLEEVDDIIRDFKRNGIAFIGTSGGDGTVHQVATRMINIYRPEPAPPLVILKGGTMDNIARTISLKGKGPAILRRLTALLRAGGRAVTHKRDTMKIGDRYCFLFGCGLTSNFLNAVYEGEKGTIKNIKIITRAIREGLLDKKDSDLFRRLSGRILIDGKELHFREILAILAGTVEQIGMGFTPLPRGNEKPGTFHIIITGEKPIEGVKQFFRIKKGLPLKGPLNFNDIISSLVMECDGPFQYTMDGDIFDCDGRLVVEMGPPMELVSV